MQNLTLGWDPVVGKYDDASQMYPAYPHAFSADLMHKAGAVQEGLQTIKVKLGAALCADGPRSSVTSATPFQRALWGIDISAEWVGCIGRAEFVWGPMMAYHVPKAVILWRIRVYLR